MHKHEWMTSEVKLRSEKAKNRRNGRASRPGYVCSGCGLVALPPKAGKKAVGWRPPGAPSLAAAIESSSAV